MNDRIEMQTLSAAGIERIAFRAASKLAREGSVVVLLIFPDTRTKTRSPPQSELSHVLLETPIVGI